MVCTLPESTIDNKYTCCQKNDAGLWKPAFNSRWKIYQIFKLLNPTMILNKSQCLKLTLIVLWQQATIIRKKNF